MQTSNDRIDQLLIEISELQLEVLERQKAIHALQHQAAILRAEIKDLQSQLGE